MPRTEPQETLSEQTESFFQTGAAADDSLAITEQKRRGDRQGWETVIDHRLVEWGRNPAQLEDEDVEPPTRTAIDLASHLAIELRDNDRPAPLRVVPNGEGGIVFERRAGAFFETLEVLGDGSIEYAAYYKSRLQRRERLV